MADETSRRSGPPLDAQEHSSTPPEIPVGGGRPNGQSPNSSSGQPLRKAYLFDLFLGEQVHKLLVVLLGRWNTVKTFLKRAGRPFLVHVWDKSKLKETGTRVWARIMVGAT